MTSYVYNPSKKVTEILSQYLEFDPEQLQLGIWSGNLSLANVNLRQEAFYPLLNNINKNSSAAAGPAAAAAAAASKNTASGSASGDELNGGDPIVNANIKPPLKFKLVSGKIGNLDMKIPWKRLVWGQGDVQVDMRNVVIVLALESHEEALEREQKQKQRHSNSTDASKSTNGTTSYLPPEPGGDNSGEADISETEKGIQKDVLSRSSKVVRAKKQKIVREAERRLLRGRSLGPWLAAIKKKEEGELAKKRGLLASGQVAAKEKESNMLKWLKSTTTDFFWRFCVGLQMNVENVKIVIVQDGIELGIIMPSNKVVAGKPDEKQQRKSSIRFNLHDVDEREEQSSSEHAGGGNNASSVAGAPPQTDVVYEGEYDDGEHVDKQLKQLGIGVYVRKLNHLFRTYDSEHMPVDVHTTDYILRPVDVDFNFSLFFPLPPEKRKRRPVAVQKSTTEDTRTAETAIEEISTVSSSSKRRRGKREKMSDTTDDTITDTTAPTTTVKPPTSAKMANLSPHNRRMSDSGALGSSMLSPKQSRRMSSLGSKMPFTNSIYSEQRSLTLLPRSNVVSTLPLARPDNIGAFYARTTKVESAGKTARFDGNLSVGAIQLVCSTRHYHMINEFLAAGARMRNGRPTISVKSAMDRERSMRKRDDAFDDSSVPIDNSLGLEVDDAGHERARVVQSWWRYVFGVMFWELRQRRRLRKIFQQKYLSFSWERQSYKRHKYVNVYIVSRLRKEGSSTGQPWSSSGRTPEEELLAIEDELSVEQVLLYRSIARSVHVHGGTTMPESILELKQEQEKSVDVESQNSKESAMQEDLKNDVGDEQNFSVADDVPSFLSMLEDRCELARQRQEADESELLPDYPPFEKRSTMAFSGGLEELSFGLVSESKTIKTFRSAKSSRPTVASTAMETMSSTETASAGMMFAFTVNVEKLELMVVEEEVASNQNVDGASSATGSNDVSHSSLNMSDVSVLTDDERFFQEHGELSASAIEESDATDSIFPSADYQVFKMPEKIILQLEIVSLSCSTLGRFGGSRNINFSIGQINATGERNVRLLAIGANALVEAPLHEIRVPQETRQISEVEPRADTPRDALTLSIVDKNNHNFLQCDAATVRVWIDTLTVSKLMAFSSHSPALYPQHLLTTSPREEVRLYVLRQNENGFAALNCSIRVHGCEATFPLKPQRGVSAESSSSTEDPADPTTSLTCDIIEIYSGSAVEELCASMEDWQPDHEIRSPQKAHEKVMTRQLRMLDVPELVATNRSLLSAHWVITASGLDVKLIPTLSSELSLFKDPIDVEVLSTVNSDSLLDFNRAKQEIVFEVSPVHVLVTEDRVNHLSRLDVSPLRRPDSQLPMKRNYNAELPPRLEVLSNFMRTSIDFSMSRIRISFLSQAEERSGAPLVSKQLSMEESMGDFLLVVSRFDLSFPHEDALSAAMQICIDRLAGVGLPLEDSWEATNLVLLNFLEDIAEARKAEDGSATQPRARSDTLDQDQKVVLQTIQTSARRTVAMYIDHLQQEDSEVRLDDDDVVIDFPDGLAVTHVGLFYDQHLSVGIPTIFIANGSGVHFLRVTPPESAPSEDSQENSLRDEVSASVEASVGSGFYRHPQNYGITWQRFVLDRDHQLGKGGLPLAILGTDIHAEDAERRVRESLDDVELGDVELLFSRQLVQCIVVSLSRMFSPLKRLKKILSNEGDDVPKSGALDAYFLATGASTSALFLSDGLCPFTRLVLSDLLVKSQTMMNLEKDGSAVDRSTRFTVQSMGILNLTPEGELFPAVVSVLPDHRGSCLCATYTAGVDRALKVEMQGLRVVLLRQFLNEFLQFFISGHYGLGSLLRSLRETRPHRSTGDGAKPLDYVVSFLNSSLILPRSSSSYDMICVEFEETALKACAPIVTFSMPDAGSPLDINENSYDNGEGVLLESAEPWSRVSRKRISILGFRIFSSLPGHGHIGSNLALDSPSFRFFFGIDGRAKAGKRVYCPRVEQEAIMETDDEAGNRERSQRIWRELTTKRSALDVVVDYAPHLRILIADPIGGNFPESGLELDIRLSQFSLLLSIWFSNMQELPSMFPFSALQLQEGSRLLHRTIEFPEFGTESFNSLLKDPAALTSEFGIVVSKLSLRCTFDDCGQEEKDGTGEVFGIRVGFHNPVVHITNDSHGVARIGAGATEAFLVDESLNFENVLAVGDGARHYSWADLRFGVGRNRSDLSMPQAFQLSIFMTPSWSLYNLGLDTPHMTLSDFSPIFKFLDFVSSYFSDAKHGNPSFEAAERAEKIKDELMKTLGQTRSEDRVPAKASNLDFRLWLTRPTLAIPCDPRDLSGPGLRIKGGGGVWYKYSSIDSLSSQECVSDSLQLVFDDTCTRQRVVSNTEEGGRTLIEHLSLGLRIDSNASSNHTDICCRIPFVDADACGYTSSRINASPVVLAPQTICTPYEQPKRCLGPTICEVTCIVELLPLTSSALLNLFTGASSPQKDGSDSVRSGSEASDSSESTDTEAGTLSLVASIGDVRLFALDPVLGPHLPVAVVSVSSVLVTASQFALAEDGFNRGGDRDAPPEDLQVSIEGQLWADYFKLGLTRSWEPLIEAYKFNALYEKSVHRGSGLSLNSDCALHLNISSALLVILDEVVDVYKRLIRNTFGADEPSNVEEDRINESAGPSDRLLLADSFRGTQLVHEIPLPLEKDDRVAFSLRNMTGQKVRIFRSSRLSSCEDSSKPAKLTYLGHSQSTRLTFFPSISMVKNLRVTEVAYPGFIGSSQQAYATVPSHTVDIQLPGFHWLEGIVVDTFGRSFADIVPRSSDVLAKIEGDWRLSNIMKVLVEVGLENGGRQVTVRSIFSVVNKTTHDVTILVNPDPSYTPHGKGPSDADEIDAEIEPGASFQIPTLLFESALRQPGSHLGFMWLKPSAGSSDTAAFHSFLAESTGTSFDLEVDLSSRPVQLSKVVSESNAMFDAAHAHDIAPEDGKSGVQLSCPVIQDTGDRLAPFCYALEISRSPLVRARTHLKHENEREKKVGHGPVAYTLSIHPPLVISNLLPEKGRFELMHAANRAVLWFGDLDPGEQVPVHSVGLDAPLLLFINLGFGKTPVGEGALVHHGTNPPPGARENLGGLKQIGKAGKAVTKQLGKTLTSMGESPDQRGQHKVLLAQNPHLKSLKTRKGRTALVDAKAESDLGLDEDVSGIDKVDGKTYKMDSFHFFPQDVASQTTIVDSLGQRLTLNIENDLGGGGQRKISVFCRFWVLNTTEHCLRYKQENSKLFVSGTVLSPDRDGSLPLTGGRSRAKLEESHDGLSKARATRYRRPLNEGTIFAGTPGALATQPGRCDLKPDQVTQLLDRNMALDQMARRAFMFSFQEGQVLAIGHQKLCVQIGDGTGATNYESDWSRGFSVDSVGISQIVSMHCKDGRALELSVVVNVAPGFLSGYTKIVRFLPRYVIVNTLPYPVRIWQDSSIFRLLSADTSNAEDRISQWRYAKEGGKRSQSKVNQYESLWGREARLEEREAGREFGGTAAHGSALYINTVFPLEIVPFTLPDSRGERQLRIDLGTPWSLTASFLADTPADHILRIKRAVDLWTLPHASTRNNPMYEVRLPPIGESSFSGELGIWFETEWGSTCSLIVKGVKKNSYAFNETDVHVGDELLTIDGVPVCRMTFAEAMGVLKSRLNDLQSKNVIDAAPKVGIRRFVARTRSGLDSASEPTPGAESFTLSFRTVEERLRSVRLKAARASGERRKRKSAPTIGQPASPYSSTRTTTKMTSAYIQAELKATQRSDVGMFLFLRDKPEVSFQVHNRSINNTIYYRQKGCSQHSWQSLNPGQSSSYSWEEPLKPKRLTVRAASDGAFQFVDDSSETVLPNNIRMSTAKNPDLDSRLRRKHPFRVLKDEEDAVFSPSTNVRLEEIGYQEFLPLHNSSSTKDKSTTSLTKYLNLQVVVEGATRALVVNDGSGEGGVEQMSRHLQSLERSISDEKKRLSELKLLNVYLAPSVEDVKRGEDKNIHAAETSRRLMQDFSEESTISGSNQIVVEILDAIGLSPESFIGSCNPYAEVWLKSPLRRRSLFKKRDLRRTYYVRKSVNPSWNSQSFVFDVPEEAVSVTRGHSVQIRLRNFRVVGSHETLGRSQVDLHSVRDQKSLVGWFPLAGRTGRRELENQLSHWGRGSVKLRVQWIHSTPSLVQYFMLLSERRLLELQDSLEGMAQQLRNKKETEEKKKAEIDGFKAVRVQELLSFSKANNRNRAAQMQRLTRLNKSVVQKILEPLRPNSNKKGWPDSKLERLFEEDEMCAVSEGIEAQQKTVSFFSPNGTDNFRRRFNSSSDITQKWEDKINLQRLNFQRFNSTRTRSEHKPTLYGESGIFSVSSFKYWASVQAVFNDSEFETELNGDKINILLRRGSDSDSESESTDFLSSSDNAVAAKFCVPTRAPSLMRLVAKRHADEFLRSRISFERAARMSLRTVLNPGGWLTIRPITALNLPDGYTGMFVKVRYGSDVLLSETADAKVMDPTWCKPEPRGGTSYHSSSRKIVEADEVGETLDRNDLHIRVAPQKTSGSIQVTVIGERSHQQLHAKAELGVVYLPLGSAIAACVDCAETSGKDPVNDPDVAMYVRWFPLTSPKDVVQVEGDGRLSTRPKESEKTSDSQFRDYFAPCIQLALAWSPDVEEGENVVEEGEKDGEEITAEMLMSSGSTKSPMVTNYFYADIGRISVALIDSQRACELLSFSALDIDVRYWVTKAKTRVGVSVGWIQLDYQDENVREPVTLAPTPTDFLVPVLQTLAVQDNLRSEGNVISLDFIDVSIAEFDLTIEESLVFDLFGFFNAVNHRKGVKLRATSRSGWDSPDANAGAFYDHRSLMTTAILDDEPTLLSLLTADKAEESKDPMKVYIKQLFLGVVKVNLSYLKGKKSNYMETAAQGGGWVDNGLDRVVQMAGGELLDQLFFHNEHSDAFLAWSQHTSDEESNANDDRKGAQNLPALVASLFPTISDAPVRLPGKALNHVFERPSEILNSVRKFYVNETLKQIYKIIGSLDFVGNPTMLVTSFFSGLRDLVVAPSTAFLKSPTDPSRVGLGVAQGTLSLVSHSTSGFFGVMAKVSAGAGQGVAALSLDNDFRIWHRDKVVVETTNLNREWKRRGVQSAGQMLARPVVDLILGATRGISGIVISPVRGYQKGGNVGLAKGIAIGGIGLIAKPTVGVLDAFTHFTASIHDIAKSVNVLDRRLQPALKVRLSYTFGLMSILAPFDAAAARAASLLKRFPRKESRSGSSTDTAETMIHVEILPSIGTETFAIVTSARVILVRVKNEPSGSLTFSLCWEVAFSEEATISSQVEDHGHSGVSLTLYKRGKNDSSEVDSSAVDDSSIASPPSSTSPRTSLRPMGLSTPEEQISMGAHESYDHGTNRGSAGELLEWFTILAEYQYRRQFTRFHNAISCITGNFDAVVRDSSLGCPHSTEGYTSFGMYFFEKENVSEEERNCKLVNNLQQLPWVSDSMFADAQQQPPNEQELYLSRVRKDWGFENELEASKRETGSEWLVLARARAAFVDSDGETATLRSMTKDGARIMSKSSSFGNFERLPTILDDGTAIETATMNSAIVRRMKFSALGRNGTGIGQLQDGSDIEQQPCGGALDSRSMISPSFRRSSLQLSDLYDRSPYKLTPGQSSTASFRTARSHNGNTPRADGNLDAFSTVRSIDDSYSVYVDARDSESFASNPLGVHVASSTPEAGGNMAAQVEDCLPTPPPPAQEQPQRPQQTVQGRLRPERNQASGVEDRMDRMEALLERLLIFSSEQALRSTTTSDDTGAVASLREEVTALRTQIQTAATTAQMMPDELALLRQEVASLRAQISLGNNADPRSGGDGRCNGEPQLGLLPKDEDELSLE